MSEGSTPSLHLLPSVSTGPRRGWISSILDLVPTTPMSSNSVSSNESKILDTIQAWLPSALTNIDSDTIPVRTPDTFDGTNPEKLDAFEGQCRMVFLGDEKRFSNSRKQALYAGSYLNGLAFDWWLQELRKSDLDFRDMANNFWVILRERFGYPDHTRIVERKLTYLRMKDTDRVNHHIIRFDTLANQLEWNEPALRSYFELSLNARLRNDLARMDPAYMRSLATMKEGVLTLDRRFWERQEELRQEKRNSDVSGKTPKLSGHTSSSVPSPSPPSVPKPLLAEAKPIAASNSSKN